MGYSGDALTATRPTLHDAILIRAKVLAAASASATLLGWLGSFHWLPDLLSHFVAWHALATAAALVAFLCLRRWPWALAAATLLVAQAVAPLSWYWPHSRVEVQANCRVLLANVLTDNTDKQALLALVAATNPDIICVQEADEAWGEALQSLDAAYPVHSIVPRSDNFGIAFYSRLPGAMQGVLFQKEHQVPALAASAYVNGSRVEILGIHTLPPMGAVMSALRNAQLASARKWLEGQTGPAILVGDLNITMFSPHYRLFAGGMKARNARAGHGPLGTWPSWVPFMRLPLDHCLVAGGITVVSCATGPRIGSDHLPLIVDLHVPQR